MAQPKTIARPYAKAIFALIKDDAAQQQWQQFLDAAAAIVSDDSVQSHLRSPDFLQTLESWLDEWLNKHAGRKMLDEERQFLHTLDGNDRLAVLPEIAELFLALSSQSHNTVLAQVKTAQTLSTQEQQALSASLEKKLGKTVALEVEEAPELLAGVVIEYDGQVIDQSLRGRLAQFARQLDD